jgi:ketosteroid isomerase-like protein
MSFRSSVSLWWGEGPGVEKEELMESVEQVFAGYTAAVRAKDVDGFVALYAADVRIFDAWGRWSYDGADAWRGMAAEWFGSLGDEQVAVEFDDVETVTRDDLAVASAFVTYKGLSAEGADLRAMSNRITWGLEKTADGGWKVVHEHTSAPVDFDTGKVHLQRSA